MFLSNVNFTVDSTEFTKSLTKIEHVVICQEMYDKFINLFVFMFVHLSSLTLKQLHEEIVDIKWLLE